MKKISLKMKSSFLQIEDFKIVERSLQENDIVIVSAPTGTGKTLGLSKYLSQESKISIALPLRAGAIGLFKALKGQRHCSLVMKGTVIYHEADPVKIFTTGSAVRQVDRFINSDILVIDEYHMRTIDIDVLLSLLLEREKKMIIMSATLDEDVADYIESFGKKVTFIEFLGNTPYTVKKVYEKYTSEFIRYFNGSAYTTALIFQPGIKSIRELEESIKSEHPNIRTAIVHSAYTDKTEIEAMIDGKNTEKTIYLATNMVANSITIPNLDILYVPSTRKDVRYYNGTPVLKEVSLSQFEITQMAGRVGRTKPGEVWFRLSEEDIVRLDRNIVPEILKTDLIDVLLWMYSENLDISQLKLRDQPSEQTVGETKKIMRFFKLINDDGITEVGSIKIKFGVSTDVAILIHQFVSTKPHSIEQKVSFINKLFGYILSENRAYRWNRNDEDYDKYVSAVRSIMDPEEHNSLEVRGFIAFKLFEMSKTDRNAFALHGYKYFRTRQSYKELLGILHKMNIKVDPKQQLLGVFDHFSYEIDITEEGPFSSYYSVRINNIPDGNPTMYRLLEGRRGPFLLITESDR